MRIAVIVVEALVALAITVAFISALISDFCLAGLCVLPFVVGFWLMVWGTWVWLFD